MSEPDDEKIKETMDHIEQVQRLLNDVTSQLTTRGYRHDLSKLLEPERSGFAQLQIKLVDCEYDSDAYRAALSEARATIEHHYRHAFNSHHPEHFDPIESEGIEQLRSDISVLESIPHPREEVINRIIGRLKQDLACAESRINRMSLLDILEMFADWKASTKRTKGGDLIRSMYINYSRFAISDQLFAILENTRKELGW